MYNISRFAVADSIWSRWNFPDDIDSLASAKFWTAFLVIGGKNPPV
jgi:hypothetical protein